VSDRDRLLELLRERGSLGITTFEIRRMGVSGNPSQRKAELEKRGFVIHTKPYKEGRRRGRRYILISGPVEVAAVEPSSDGVHGSGDLGGEVSGSTASSAPGPREHAAPGAPIAPESTCLPTPDVPHEGSSDSGGLFDADAFKPKRQHDREAA
jgi:hypothetical protein